MACQTLILSSFNPKFTNFCSRFITPLALPSPLRTFGSSSSLPTPSLHLKASSRRLHTSHFKCYTSQPGEANVPRNIIHGVTWNGWQAMEEAEENKELQGLGRFATEEHNENEKCKHMKIEFIRVVEAESRMVVGGINFRLWIQGQTEEDVNNLFMAVVFVGPVVHPKFKELEAFVSADRRNQLINYWP